MRRCCIAFAVALLAPGCGDDSGATSNDTLGGSTSVGTTTTTSSGTTTSGSASTVTCSVSETTIERTENGTEQPPLIVVGEATGNIAQLQVRVVIDGGPLFTVEGSMPDQDVTRPAESPFHYEYPLSCMGTGSGELEVSLTATSADPGVADVVERKTIPYLCLAGDSATTGSTAGGTGDGTAGSGSTG